MMKLPTVPEKISLQDVRIMLRVDWNIPLHGKIAVEDLLKMERSMKTIEDFRSRGAVVILLTHLGRPRGVDPAFSTRKLAAIARRRFGLRMTCVSDLISTADGLARVQARCDAAEAGDVLLLENVRFMEGEESNDRKLAKAYASIGDVFVNDAFASSHRAHVSVVGLAKILPAFAGPTLVAEVAHMQRLIEKPKKPFVAIIGGAKLSTKMGIISSLLKIADAVCIGGAMAHPFFVAQGHAIGKSLIDEQGISFAKTLLNNKKIHLPIDVHTDARPHESIPVTWVKKGESILDAGDATLDAWSQLIAAAKTIVWNGPIGTVESKAFARGSSAIARMIGERSRRRGCYGVIGGGDTLPIALCEGLQEDVDFLSTGGGAMLEFLAKKGTLPGLVALTH